MPSDCTTEYRSTGGTSTAGTTSETSAEEAQYPDFSEAAKRRVKKVDLNEGRCAITDAQVGVDYAHILPRNTKSEILDAIEYNMGMEWRTLNLDSRYNVLLLEPSLRAELFKFQWALLPELEIVLELEKIFYVEDRTKRGPLYDALLKKRTTFNYTLLPSRSMKTFRIPKSTNGSLPCSPQSQEYHEYPFTDLVIVSHIQPHFAILDTGIKVREINGPFNYNLFETLLTPEKEIQLFHIPYLSGLWRRDIPEDARDSFLQEKRRQSGSVDSDTSSVATAPRRLEPIPFIGPLPNPPAFPFLSLKRPHENDDILPLHRKSLRKLERASRDSRETRDKSTSVSDWVAGVTSDPPSTNDVQ